MSAPSLFDFAKVGTAQVANNYQAQTQIQAANIKVQGAALQTKQSLADSAAEIANQKAMIADLTRQQREVNVASDDQKSDRMRQATADLATARAAAAAGFGNNLRAAASLGYVMGIDLGRIETNRVSNVTSLQSRKEAAGRGVQYATDQQGRAQERYGLAMQDYTTTSEAALQGAAYKNAGVAISAAADSFARTSALTSAGNVTPNRAPVEDLSFNFTG